MPVYIKDDETTRVVAELARLRGVSKSKAVRDAVKADLQRIAPEPTLAEKLRQFRAEHPLPPRTGQIADKAFFDELSGDW
jgi:antitoxin VapB